MITATTPKPVHMFRSVRGVFCSGCSSISTKLLATRANHLPQRRRERRELQRLRELLRDLFCALDFHFCLSSISPPLERFCRIVHGFPCVGGLRRIFPAAGLRQLLVLTGRDAAVPARKIIL